MSENIPVLPYGGDTNPNSGAAGSVTSIDRARREDADGTTRDRQHTTLARLRLVRGEGVTWRELASAEGWHHGQASGVLSTLHKAGKITRLTERRNRCLIYVLSEYVDGRPESAGQGTSTGALLNEMGQYLTSLESRIYSTGGVSLTPCDHLQNLGDPDCAVCELRRVVSRYSNRNR